MAFTGNEGEMIDASLGQKWIDNYQAKAGPDAKKWEFFGFRKIMDLLKQENAMGVRMYYAVDDEGVQQLVLVAVNPDEKNIAKVDGSKTEGLVLDRSVGCPPYCTNND